MEDVSPGLLEKLRALFLALLGEDAPSADTYAAAGDYAERVGDALAEAFRQQLSGDVLPDGKMYWNIADRVVRPLLEEDWRLCAGAAADVQRALNKAAGLGLAPQAPKPDQDRIDGILHTLCAAERYEDKAWMLNEPVRTFSRAAVDETLRCNAEFQFRAGLRPRVIRTAEAGCCKWCSALAGTYSYPDVPRDVYRRHANCRCAVEYDPGGGKRQDVWTKRWTEPAETLEQRKSFQGIDTTPRVREIAARSNEPENVLPEYLRNATPGKGSVTYDKTFDKEGHPAEVRFSEWLHRTFGGDLHLLDEVNQDKVKTPDYLWRGKLWDLKTTTTEKSANSAIRSGLHQIWNNPGGIILDYRGNEIDIAVLKNVIQKRLWWTENYPSIDIMIVLDDTLVKIWRYAEKK